MKVQEINAAVLGGRRVVVGEYRASKIEEIKWKDKETHQPKQAVFCRHTVEFGPESVQVNERVPEGAAVSDIKVPWVKGQIVALVDFTWEIFKGASTVRGTLQSVEGLGK